MSDFELNKLIEERERLDRLISEYQESSEKLTATAEVMTPTKRGFDITEVMKQVPKEYWFSDDMCFAPRNSINIDLSTTINVDNRVVNDYHKHSDVATTITSGDSALGALGGLIGKIFS